MKNQDLQLVDYNKISPLNHIHDIFSSTEYNNQKFNYLDNPFYYMDKEFELHHHGQQDEDPSYVTSRNGQINNNNTTGDGNSSKRKEVWWEMAMAMAMEIQTY